MYRCKRIIFTRNIFPFCKKDPKKYGVRLADGHGNGKNFKSIFTTARYAIPSVSRETWARKGARVVGTIRWQVTIVRNIKAFVNICWKKGKKHYSKTDQKHKVSLRVANCVCTRAERKAEAWKHCVRLCRSSLECLSYEVLTDLVFSLMPLIGRCKKHGMTNWPLDHLRREN